MHGLCLSGFSKDWNILKAFHEAFKRSVTGTTTTTWGGVERYTRSPDLSEIIRAYDQAMTIWEDRARLLRLEEPTDVVSSDDFLSKMTPQRELSLERFTTILDPRIKTGQWAPTSKGAGKGATTKGAAEGSESAQVWSPRKKPRVSPKKKPDAAAKVGPVNAFGKTYLIQKALDQAKAAHATKKEKEKGADGKGSPAAAKAAKKGAGKLAKTHSTKEWMKTQPCYYYSSGKCQRGAKCPWKH